MIDHAQYLVDGRIQATINGVEWVFPDNPDGIERKLVAEWEGEGNKITSYVEPEPAPIVIIVPAVTLWERMTEKEAAQVETAMSTQPFRTRQIFMTAKTFRSDYELWPLLENLATALFGEERASQMLSPSE